VAMVPPAPSSASLRITFVDVKEGDAILIQLGSTNLLVDTGRPGGCTNLLSVLKAVKGPLKTLFLTHPHDDHYGCAKKVLQEIDVAEIITNGEKRGPPRDAQAIKTWHWFAQEAHDRNLDLKHLVVGDVVRPCNGLPMTVLSTGSPTGGEYPDTDAGKDINNDSLTFMLEFAGRRVLLSGDIQTEADKLLIQRRCEAGQNDCLGLKADILKVPHHGSAEFDPHFFAMVHPQWAVVSADYKYTSHHLPRVEPIEALQQLGTTIYSTSAEGDQSVEVEISPAGAVKWTKPSSAIFAWTKSHEEKTFSQ
jgi:competence protein ComEC